MELKKWLKDSDFNISGRCYQMEELEEECKTSDKGITVLTEELAVSRVLARTKRNNNILVVDDKERNFQMELENLQQDSSNYVVVDFDGEYYKQTATDFKKRGYRIKCINLMDEDHSDGYNPFTYMTDEVDIDTVVQCIITNTTSKYIYQIPESDRALVRSMETTFLKLLFSCYMRYGTTKTLTVAANLLQGADREIKLDKLFSGNYTQGPNEMECKRFRIFKEDAGSRYADILQSCNERMQVFKTEKMAKLAENDTLELDKLALGKQVLFIIIPSIMKEVELFTSILLSQILYMLCKQSRKNNNDRTVMLYLNYFADAGIIYNLDRMIAEFTHYNVGCMIHVNNLSRIIDIYPKWRKIFDYCDIILHFGSMDDTTLRYVMEKADSVMIRKKQIWKKAFYLTATLKQDEVKKIDTGKCICIIKGLATFLSTPKMEMKQP